MVDHVIAIDAGSGTDDLKNFIMQGLTDEQLDALDIRYDRGPSTGLANEPVIIAVIITIKGGEAIGAAIVATMGFLIAKYMDQRYDREMTNQMVRVNDEDPEKAKVFMKHLDKYEKVAISQERYMPKAE